MIPASSVSSRYRLTRLARRAPRGERRLATTASTIESTSTAPSPTRKYRKPGVIDASIAASALILHPTFEEPQLDQRQQQRDGEQRDREDRRLAVVVRPEHRRVDGVHEHVG